MARRPAPEPPRIPALGSHTRIRDPGFVRCEHRCGLERRVVGQPDRLAVREQLDVDCPLLKKDSPPRMNVTIRPSGDKLGAVAESVKLVICVYSDADVTGTAGVAADLNLSPAATRPASTSARPPM